MKLYYWIFDVDSSRDWFNSIILFDGESTYWCEQMRPSGGYGKRILSKVCKTTNSKYVYIGEL